MVFDRVAGQRVCVGVTEVGFSGGAGLFGLSVLGPYGATSASKLVGRLGGDIDTAPLSDTGTYTIVVDPGALAVDLVLTISEPVTGAISVGDPATPVAVEKPGRDARVTFAGDAGKRVDLGVGDVTLPTGSGAVEVSIIDRSGATSASKFVFRSGRGIHTDPLPDTGTYTIVINPESAQAVRLALTLSEPLIDALAIGGPSVGVDLRPGQTQYRFFRVTWV